MSVDPNAVEARSRRHVIRIAALLGASAALSVIPGKKANAAGRHSDPFYCPPVCMVRGTLIETATGPVCVELLQIGDLVRTVDGDFKRVGWIGHKKWTKPADAPWGEDVDPVLVCASAIAPGVPSRDLYLSPMHAIYIDGYLIPAKFLINGASIRQGCHTSDVVEYFHIECDSHQVVYAEGLPVETFRLIDNYGGFENGAEREIPGQPASTPEAYAPVLGYWSGRQDVVALLRSLGSSFRIDLRDPIQVAYDRIAERALELAGNEA